MGARSLFDEKIKIEGRFKTFRFEELKLKKNNHISIILGREETN